MPRSILWFRRDLRLVDHPALAAAADHGEVVPLFVVDPVFSRAGDNRRAFMARALGSLDEGLSGTLVYRHGRPTDEVCRLAVETGASVVFASEDFGPYGRRRDEAVRTALGGIGVRLNLVGSPYVVEPGTVRKHDGTSYAVFTPFRRAWSAVSPRCGWMPVPTAAPGEVHWVGAPTVACDDPPAAPTTAARGLPEATEAQAHRRLTEFVADHADDYGTRRNLPGVDGTSRLSPYLRWGLLHPRQVLAVLGDRPGHDVLRSELCWREFYADVLHHRPQSAWENLRPTLDGLVVDTDAHAVTRFQAWREGRTGFPIVDAGMRQLEATGWVHNRVRMIVASFLVKDLHLPWQWGARHFMDRLVDGDLASNSHGWQWTAGTGTDASPYYRVFNPIAQGERFDPQGAYVRQWVPELAGVADGEVHAPWMAHRGPPLGYPGPIVDHAAERVEALRRYASAMRR